MPKLLLEDSFGTFVPDRQKVVTESTPSGKQVVRIPGRFSLCDTVNGNNRRYSKQVWEKNLAPGSTLQDYISRNAAFGLLEHPKDGRVDLLSPIAITTSKVIMNEGKELVGEITVLGTPEGQRLLALIEGGWNPTVSSRGFGSLVRAHDGIDDVQDDFVCEGWDVVLKPSFTQAVFQANPPPQAAFAEAKPAQPAAAAPNLRESTPSTSPSASQTPKQTNKIMSESIKQKLQALEALDCSKLDPARFSAGLAEMNGLHQEVANFLAEDQKRSWEANQLHARISSLEETWSAAAHAPKTQVTKLTEDRGKLLKVTEAVVKGADRIRQQLGEATKATLNQRKLVAEAVQRGKLWRAKASRLESMLQDLQQRLSLVENQYEVAACALDKITARYHTDTTPLARRIIQLEFKDKITPEINEKLTEATCLAHVVAIRESLEEKPAAAPVTESKPAAAPATPAPVVESHVNGTMTQPNILSRPVCGPQSISESASLAKRLTAQVATAP